MSVLLKSRSSPLLKNSSLSMRESLSPYDFWVAPAATGELTYLNYSSLVALITLSFYASSLYPVNCELDSSISGVIPFMAYCYLKYNSSSVFRISKINSASPIKVILFRIFSYMLTPFYGTTWFPLTACLVSVFPT